MEKVTLPNEVLLDEVARLLSEGRDVVLSPKGRSMLPFIREGKDTVMLRKMDQVARGDIVLVRYASSFVMHRVIAVEGNTITLMGDGNLTGNEQVDKAAVCGTVMEIIGPDGRYRKPSKGGLWRRLLPIRKYLLKVYRKWNKWFCKQQ